MTVNEINVFSLDNNLIGSICNYNGKIIVEDYKQLYIKIKKFNNVSKNNPHKIYFVPFGTSINLEFFTDIICSSYTNFYVIYTKIYTNIEKSIYKIHNSYWFKCEFYDIATDISSHMWCKNCINCLCLIKKENSYTALEERISLAEQ